jgi:hypothetical protein
VLIERPSPFRNVESTERFACSYHTPDLISPLKKANRLRLVFEVEAAEVLLSSIEFPVANTPRRMMYLPWPELLERWRIHRRNPGRIVGDRRDSTRTIERRRVSLDPARVVGDPRVEHRLVLERGGIVRRPARVQPVDPLFEDVIAVQLIDLEVAADVEGPALVERAEPRMALDDVVEEQVLRLRLSRRNPRLPRAVPARGEGRARPDEVARSDWGIPLQVLVEDRRVVEAGQGAILAESDLLGVLARVEDRRVDAVVAELVDVEAEPAIDRQLFGVGAGGLVEAPVGEAELACRQIAVGKSAEAPAPRAAVPP